MRTTMPRLLRSASEISSTHSSSTKFMNWSNPRSTPVTLRLPLSLTGRRGTDEGNMRNVIRTTKGDAYKGKKPICVECKHDGNVALVVYVLDKCLSRYFFKSGPCCDMGEGTPRILPATQPLHAQLHNMVNILRPARSPVQVACYRYFLKCFDHLMTQVDYVVAITGRGDFWNV